MSLQDVKDVLHKIVDAAVGVGRATELHEDIDAIGAPAPVAEPAADVAEPVVEVPAEAPPTADELAAFRAWQASQATTASEVTDAQA